LSTKNSANIVKGITKKVNFPEPPPIRYRKDGLDGPYIPKPKNKH